MYEISVAAPKGLSAEAWLVRMGKDEPLLVEQYELEETDVAADDVPTGFSAAQVQCWRQDPTGVFLSDYPSGEYSIMVRLMRGDEVFSRHSGDFFEIQ